MHIEMSESFVIERTFNASVEQVWKALTNKECMKQWYFDIPDFKPKVGCKFVFYGQGEDCVEYKHICVVTDVIEHKKLTHTWRYEGYVGESIVSFELTSNGKSTLLKLTHTGIETFPMGNKAFAKTSFADGWSYIIGTSLQKYLEK